MSKKLVLFGLSFLLMLSVFSQKKLIYEVTIKGAKKTNLSFLANIIDAKKGKTVDSLALKEDVIRLKRLPSIAHARFSVFYSHENFYKVIFEIEESHTLIPDINIWTTTNQKTAYKLSLTEFNFLGRNIEVGGFYQNNGFDSYGFIFKAPYLFSKKWGLAVYHQNWISEEPLYVDNQTANYKYQNVSFEFLGLYQLNFKNSFQFGINFFKEKYDYLNGYTSVNLPQHLDVNKKLFKLGYFYNNLDYHYQYAKGFKNDLYVQYVTSNEANQEDFLIAWNDFFYYRMMGAKGNWASRVRFGLSTNSNSPFSPFSLDNNVNIRGVGILVDRGTGTLVINTEYRHTLIDRNWFILQSNTFIDAGSWRKPGGTLNDFFQSENMQIYTGVGLRFIHKKIVNAVFRIDYGYGLSKNSSQGLVFGIGQYF